jgi:glycerate kinase
MPNSRNAYRGFLPSNLPSKMDQPRPSNRHLSKHILVAFDKFKGAHPACQAGEVLAGVLRRCQKKWPLDLCPLANGGEGFAEVLTSAADVTLHRVRVTGPRRKRVTAKYGLVRVDHIPRSAWSILDFPDLPANAQIAIVEMAQASGLALLEEDLHDPWHASTSGTGPGHSRCCQ